MQLGWQLRCHVATTCSSATTGASAHAGLCAACWICSNPFQPAPPPVVYVPPVIRAASAPNKLQMNCHPTDSSPYFVTYNGYAGTVLVTGSNAGLTRSYPVRDVHDDTGRGIFYVNARRDDQNRTLFFAFNYSNDGSDGSIRVKGFNSDGTYSDAHDICTPIK